MPLRASIFVVVALAVAATDAKTKVVGEDPFFLEMNKLQEGVVSLPSGLQYKVLQSGQADDNLPPITMLSKCTVRFEGTLTDGTIFAPSSVINVKVKEVFAAWQEALKLMLPGDRWMPWVPAALHS